MTCGCIQHGHPEVKDLVLWGDMKDKYPGPARNMRSSGNGAGASAMLTTKRRTWVWSLAFVAPGSPATSTTTPLK